MHAYCTYCSWRKKLGEEPLPALERYDSDRIRAVHAASDAAGKTLYILSGAFGLLAPDEPIPWYDHLLTDEEVESLSSRVGNQLQRFGVSLLVYFTAPVTAEPAVEPYQATIVQACRIAQVALEINEL